MPTVYDVADAIADRLADLDLTALALLEEHYHEISSRIEAELASMPSGTPQQARLSALRAELGRILNAWGIDAATIVELAQDRALVLVGTEAQQLSLAALGAAPLGARLPSLLVPAEALNSLIGFVGNGPPLREYFDQMADSLAEAVMAAYLDGVARGIGPRQIGASVRRVTGEPLHRAQAMARTATINAYREAQRRIFQTNSDVVTGWTWSATLDARTCVVCWAMHGTVHVVSERLESHWNCRCAMIPRTKTWRELGFGGDSEPADLEPGPAQFARLTPAAQRAILGPGKLAEYAAGRASLPDFVQLYQDSMWGTMRAEKALRDL